MTPAPYEMVEQAGLYKEITDAKRVGSRPLGVIDPDLMADAVRDEDAITVRINGENIPTLVPVEYADGYDASRCHGIVGEYDPAKVLYYVLPAHLGNTALSGEALSELGNRSYGYIFYDSVQTDEIPPLLVDAFELVGHDYEELPLLDEEAEAGNEQASISLYGFDFPVEHPERVIDNPRLKDVYELYKEGVVSKRYEYNTEAGAVMIRGDEIDEKLFEELWVIYQDRFQWLGEKHPVSMEDSKESFSTVLRNDNTLACIQYHENQPVCFTYLSEGAESLYWLNSDFLDSKTSMHMREAQTLLFIPGIVSNKAGEGYSLSVLSLISNVAIDYNGDFKVVFENTNRSERYIPRIAQSVINGLGRGQIKALEVIDRTVYGCVQFGRRPKDEAAHYTS